MKMNNDFNFSYNMNGKVLEVFDKYQEYLCFHSNPLVFDDSNKILEFKVLELLENLGFSIYEIGTFFYSEIIVKIINILEVLEKTKSMYYNHFLMEDVNIKLKEVKKNLITELENLSSSFYKDLLKKEISLSFYHSYINKALPVGNNNNKRSINYGLLAYEIASNIIEGNPLVTLDNFNIIVPNDQKKLVKIYL